MQFDWRILYLSLFVITLPVEYWRKLGFKGCVTQHTQLLFTKSTLKLFERRCSGEHSADLPIHTHHKGQVV